MQRPTMVVCQLEKPVVPNAKQINAVHNAPYLVKLENNDYEDQKVPLKGVIITCDTCGNVASAQEYTRSFIGRLSGQPAVCSRPECVGTNAKFYPADMGIIGAPGTTYTGTAFRKREYLGVVHDAQFSDRAIVSCQVAGLVTTMDGKSVIVNSSHSQ